MRRFTVNRCKHDRLGYDEPAAAVTCSGRAAGRGGRSDHRDLIATRALIAPRFRWARSGVRFCTWSADLPRTGREPGTRGIVRYPIPGALRAPSLLKGGAGLRFAFLRRLTRR